jgi:phosphoribosylaminoimidazole-succinocarboxamide synthase
MGAMELRPDSHGKVRDIYDCGDSLLMVASDRISAYDFILPDEWKRSLIYAALQGKNMRS